MNSRWGAVCFVVSAVAAMMFGSPGVAGAVVIRGCPIVKDPAENHHTICPGKNFDGMDFAGFDLQYADFRHSSFGRANLTNVTLDDADLREAIFTGATLTGSTMSDARFQHANFTGTRLMPPLHSYEMSMDGRAINFDSRIAELDPPGIPGATFIGCPARDRVIVEPDARMLLTCFTKDSYGESGFGSIYLTVMTRTEPLPHLP